LPAIAEEPILNQPEQSQSQKPEPEPEQKPEPEPEQSPVTKISKTDPFAMGGQADLQCLLFL